MQAKEALMLLRQNVVPALGCTEPVCAGLSAADAAKAAGGQVKEIYLEVSRNIYKNGVSVGIAGFDKVGLDYAAALGAEIGDTSRGLELMKGITPAVAERAEALVSRGAVHVTVDETMSGVYARCRVVTDNGDGISLIRSAHTNIVYTEANGQVLYQAEKSSTSGKNNSLTEKLKQLRVADIRTLAEALSEEELAFLLDGVEMNEALAEHNIKENVGIGMAAALYREAQAPLLGSGLMAQVMTRVAAATEARLDGCPLATMSSAGSGSKGIAVILPVAETAQAVNATKEHTLQALAFAHLMNEYINAHIGKLSAICACAMASATAASAAITWLLGGTDEQIAYAIRNMTGSITGMICDGGKVGCALKLSTAMGTAFLSAVLALNSVGLRPTDGICAASAEDCIRNMGRVSNPGMVETDREILRIMAEKIQ